MDPREDSGKPYCIDKEMEKKMKKVIEFNLSKSKDSEDNGRTFFLLKITIMNQIRRM